MLYFFLLGLVASTIHIVASPQHLLFITSFSVGIRGRSYLLSLLWSLGHSLSAIFIGFVFLFFNKTLHTESISFYGSKFIGLFLILFGLYYLVRTHKHKKHKHEEDHHLLNDGKYALFLAFLVGLLHGFTCISHIIGVLPIIILPTTSKIVIYLLGFVLGSSLLVIIYTFIIGKILDKFTHNRKEAFIRKLNIFAAILVILVGLFFVFYFHQH